nr:RNA-directed DNA polymerase, eukaryota [Tanacetum cinerariifolium]
MGDNEWQEVSKKKFKLAAQRVKFPSSGINQYFSKEDQTKKISRSVFVTNIPDHFSARDLWNVCVAYGKVVDIFIPFKRSQAGKKFAFVRFISVDNLDRLIGNLCTIWIGRLKLHANKEKLNINALSNLHFLLDNKGFGNVKLLYLGGHWVLLEMDSVDSKDKIIEHVGVNSLFVELKQASNSFVCEERLVWVLVEGLTIKAHTRLGNKAKQESIQVLNIRHRVNLVSIQETKMDNMDLLTIKKLWGNVTFDYAFSPSIGYSGGTWTPTSTKLLIISVYAPQDLNDRRILWDFFRQLLDSWDGYSFTRSHKYASKMSKLDRFLISEGLLVNLPYISALCLDKHLSDHMPILLCELNVDYEPTSFCFFRSWFSRKGFDKMVEDPWKNYDNMSSNSILNLMNKLRSLKSAIKLWLSEDNKMSNANKQSILSRLIVLDKSFDQGTYMAQKAKIRWAIEGDENSKFFHGIINKKRSQLDIRGTWTSTSTKLLIISVYAPQDLNDRRILWDFFRQLLNSWDGECVLL